VVTCAADETSQEVMDAIAGLPGVEQVEQVGAPAAEDASPDAASGMRLRLYLDGEGAGHIAPVAALLARRGTRLGSVVLGEPTLEDVFLTLTGRDLR